MMRTGFFISISRVEVMEFSTSCTSPRAKQDLVQFMNERWKGMFPVAWGETMREAEFTSWIYSECLGIGDEAEDGTTPETPVFE